VKPRRLHAVTPGNQDYLPRGKRTIWWMPMPRRRWHWNDIHRGYGTDIRHCIDPLRAWRERARDLPPPWIEIAETTWAAFFEDELHREMPPGHPLYRVAFLAMACRDHKNVLFRILDSDRWARVHLTYNPEIDPQWPWTYLYDDWPAALRAITPPPRTEDPSAGDGGTGEGTVES
jgi:hypothetical protein